MPEERCDLEVDQGSDEHPTWRIWVAEPLNQDADTMGRSGSMC